MGMEMNNLEKERPSPRCCTELLQRFKAKEALPIGEKLQFSGVAGRDVYNITAPFLVGDKTVIAGRVEARETWADSQVMFFEEKNSVWSPINGAPTFKLEDGFVTKIGDETIFGGVEVYPNPDKDNPKEVGYRTVFYRGQDLSSLEKFSVGPNGMKDIRLVSLANEHIGVFTRPQGGESGKGKIGYIEIERLLDLNEQNLLNAKIIENQFAPEEWGGVNDLHLLEDGKIGAVGHVAYMDEQGTKHYYAMIFVYNPETHLASPIEIIATRENFPTGSKKAPEVADIIFPSSLVCNGDQATLYAGLSDAEAGINSGLPNPFKGKILSR